jgi:hypothetical protein
MIRRDPLTETIIAAVREAVGQALSDIGQLPADRLGYTEQQAAEALGIARHVLRDCRLRGEIAARKVGKTYVFSRVELLTFLNSHSQNGRTTPALQ